MAALARDQRLLEREKPHPIAGSPDQEIVLEALKRCHDRTGFKPGGCYQVRGRNVAVFGNTVVYGPVQIFLTHTYSFFRADRYTYSCAARTVPAVRAAIRAVLREEGGAGRHRGMVGRRMVDYKELADLAERLFEASDDDDERLAERLDTLDGETRGALLASDLLNAYQVFYYCFRETPDDLAVERLQLHAASDLARGIVIDEIDIYDLVFSVKGGNPVLVLTDGENTLARFEGERAYGEILEYLDEHP